MVDYYIYGFIDPRNNQLMYIGKTEISNRDNIYSFHDAMEKRLKGHKGYMNFKPERDLSKWLKSLYDANLEPQPILLGHGKNDKNEELILIGLISTINKSLLNKQGSEQYKKWLRENQKVKENGLTYRLNKIESKLNRIIKKLNIGAEI